MDRFNEFMSTKQVDEESGNPRSKERSNVAEHKVQTEGKMAFPIEDTIVLEAPSGEGSSGVKNTKQAHNAKERMRRMNLNASYSTLRYLLPNSKRSKKRWSAPKIVDKALKYIPELQKEIESLTLEKENRATLSQETNKSQSHATDPSISITEVTKGELIIQVSSKSAKSILLSDLMRKIEDKGMSVKGSSSVEISDDRVCCHVHIEMNTHRPGVDEIAILRDELASWLH